MKSFFQWVIKNLWNLFGILGVLGTFYFSLFYVPSYVKDITTGRESVIHESLIDDVQEILFYEKHLTIKDIDAFIYGKELKQGVSYPFSSDELLVQVQERFMGNKFIPLEKRESILDSIKTIRKTYTPPEKPVKKAFNWRSLLPLIFSGLGVLVGVLGFLSLINKNKFDRETEVDIAINDINDETMKSTFPNIASRAYEYEHMVGEVLKELNVLDSSNSGSMDGGFDFIAKKGKNKYFIEVKRYNKLLGLGTARVFLAHVLTSESAGILIVSSGVTQRAKQSFEEYNKIAKKKKAYLVTGLSRDEVKSQLEKIIK